MAFQLSDAAQADLDAVYEHIASEAGFRTADRTVDSLLESCELLGRFPRMGVRRPDLDASGVECRSLAQRNYLIFYAESAQGAEILRIVHGARDLSRGLSFRP